MTLIWFLYVLTAVALLILMMFVWRQLDRRANRAAWDTLATTGVYRTAVFDPLMVAKLPEPARRYFAFTIEPGGADTHSRQN